MNPQEAYDRQHGIIQAIWCIDSETSEECLVDLYTKQIIAKRVDGKIVDPGEKNGRAS